MTDCEKETSTESTRAAQSADNLCSVCGRTTPALLKCSRCKDDAYRVCSKDCQAKDWKRHKNSDCYVFDAVLKAQSPQILAEFPNQQCPICQDHLTVRDILRRQLRIITPCQHVVHDKCAKSSVNDSAYKNCPICRTPTSENLGTASQSPWYTDDPMALLHKALGYAFQARHEGRGKKDDEKKFILDHIAATIQCGQRDMALHIMRQGQNEYLQLLPKLRTLDSIDARQQQVQLVMEKITTALGIVFFPATLDGQHDAIMEEQQTWFPHLETWVESLQLLGPY